MGKRVKFEYMIHGGYPNPTDPQPYIDDINDYGSEGWEAVGFTPDGKLLMKRAYTEPGVV